MDNCKKIGSCDHLNQINDHHEGVNTCIDCGLVLENVYENSCFSREVGVEIENISSAEKDNREMIMEILDKLNLPDKHIDFIVHDLKTNFKKRIPKSEKIASSIYACVNTSDECLPLNLLSSVSGITKKHVKHPLKMQIQVNPEIALEKFCNILNLNYNDYTLIKGDISQYENTGFNPLTVVGGLIYKFCKENNKKISMKRVGDVVGINSISIQRFLKYANSQRV